MEKVSESDLVKRVKGFIINDNYAGALAVVKGVDASRIKNPSVLCTIGEVYMHEKQYETAEGIFLRAYERSPKNRRILDLMTSLYIEMGEYAEAEYYYNEFISVASRDLHRYILRYRIDRGKGERLSVLIDTLEKLKDYEYIEEWAYELALLYEQAGERKKCIHECEEIVLWFGQGEYVDKAIAMKNKLTGQSKSASESVDIALFDDTDEYVRNPDPISYGGKKDTGIDVDMIRGALAEEQAEELPDTGQTQSAAAAQNAAAEKKRTAQEDQDASKKLMEDLFGTPEFSRVRNKSGVSVTPQQAAADMEAASVQEAAAVGKAEAVQETVILGNLMADNVPADVTDQMMQQEQGSAAETAHVREDADKEESDAAETLTDAEQLQEFERFLSAGMGDLSEEEMFWEDLDDEDLLEEAFADTGFIGEDLTEEDLSDEDFSEEDFASEEPAQEAGTGEEFWNEEMAKDLTTGNPADEDMQKEAPVEDSADGGAAAEVLPDDFPQDAVFADADFAEEDLAEEDLTEEDLASEEPAQEDRSEEESGLKDLFTGILPDTDSIDEYQDEENSLREDMDFGAEDDESEEDLSAEDEAAVLAALMDEALMDRELSQKGREKTEIPVDFLFDKDFPDDDFAESVIPERDALKEDTSKRDIVETDILKEELAESAARLSDLTEDDFLEDDYVNEEELQRQMTEENEKFLEALYKTGDVQDADDADAAEEMTIPQTVREIFDTVPDVKDVHQQLAMTLTQFEASDADFDVLAPYDINFLVVSDDTSMKSQIALGIAKALNTYGLCDKTKIVRASARELNRQDFSMIFDKIAGGCLIVPKADLLSDASAAIIEKEIEQENQDVAIVLESKQEELQEFWKKHPKLRGHFLNVINVSKYNEMELVTLGKSYIEKRGFELSPEAAILLRDLFKKHYEEDDVFGYEDVMRVMDEGISNLEKRNMENLFMTVLDNKYEEAQMFKLRAEDFQKIE